MEDKVNVTKRALTDIAAWLAASGHITDDYMKVVGEIVDVVVKKNHDYGDAWQRYGIFTPLIRLNDKLLRVKTLAGGEKAMVADEVIQDTLKDIVAYGLLALLRIDWEANQSKVADTQLPLFDPENIMKAIGNNNDDCGEAIGK